MVVLSSFSCVVVESRGVVRLHLRISGWVSSKERPRAGGEPAGQWANASENLQAGDLEEVRGGVVRGPERCYKWGSLLSFFHFHFGVTQESFRLVQLGVFNLGKFYFFSLSSPYFLSPLFGKKCEFDFFFF